MEKRRLRRELHQCLLAILPEQRKLKSTKACEYLVATPEFQRASTVMMYLALPEEVDTSEAILHAWQRGKQVAVPKVSFEHRHMIPVEIHSLDTEMVTQSMGLRHPASGTPVVFEAIDLVVAPGLAFDRSGNRLGRGGSYYDRFFAHESLRAARCGFGFAEQLIEAVPATETDQPVDVIVTDEGITRIHSAKGV